MMKFVPVLGGALLFCSPVVALDPIGGAPSRPRLHRTEGKVCTMEYNPVCATKSGRRREYSNRCRAMADDATNIRPGNCARRR